jgi:hypothetical protein
VGDYFKYYEVVNLGSGTGSYADYTEKTIINGTETMNEINGSGVVSAYYNYSSTWTPSTGTPETESMSGNFTFSSVTFLYVNGTDNQTGYTNPTVWFYMNNSIHEGDNFTLLNTEMTVTSRNYSYYLPSQNRNVNTIFAQGASNYLRNDQYGQFYATYTWNAYFDPSTGYIIGYDYVEHDTNSSGDGFTYTESLYVNSTSYPLTAAAAGSNPSGGNSGSTQYFGYIVVIVLVIVIIAIILYLYSRRRTLPKHPSEQKYPPPSRPSPPPPQDIDLTPKQPPVQQIVIKEVVKVKCRYCGALIDSTAEVCPFCGAPRT